MRIGITSKKYPNIRNINGITDYKYVYINLLNKDSYLKQLSKHLPIKKRYKKNKYIAYRGFLWDGLFYDLAHFFNYVSLSNTLWVTSFETTVPYYKNEIESFLHGNNDYLYESSEITKALKACASDSCKALIAISRNALNNELSLLSHFPYYEGKILPKIKQLYPPQRLFSRDPLKEKRTSLDKRLRFMFVGRQFYHKGGLEVLRCFNRLSKKYEFELIIVSTLSNDWPEYFDEQIVSEVEDIIKKSNGRWLKYYYQLDNSSLIELMQTTDVGLLPTYRDTFGYSVLEFQACGCPVITTDIRALTELNNCETGWIINAGFKNEFNDFTDLAEVIISGEIEKQLSQIVIEILEKPDTVLNKAKMSIERIKAQHSPENYKQALTSIYNSCI